LTNRFDRTNYPTAEPSLLVAGDRFTWRRDDLANDYPVGTFALSYEFHKDSGGSGTDKRFTITAIEWFILAELKSQPILQIQQLI
jgi:hypothetical protein